MCLHKKIAGVSRVTIDHKQKGVSCVEGSQRSAPNDTGIFKPTKHYAASEGKNGVTTHATFLREPLMEIIMQAVNFFLEPEYALRYWLSFHLFDTHLPIQSPIRHAFLS